MLSEFQILLRKLVDEKTGISLRHGRDLGLVKADRVQLEQVMIDLVANARDALPAQGGKIQIRTKRIKPSDCAGYHHPTLPPDDYVLIEVEDNGCGISDEIKEKIFDPFFTTKSVGAGAGLGLSSAIGVVQQSNGYILCDSIIDQGSVFRIFLPQHTIAELPNDEPLAEPPVINPDPRPAGNEPGTGSILLVDDDDAVRSFAAHALRKAGFVVHESINGQDALDVMTQLSGNIDVVISDVEMPEMDGPSMAVQISDINPATKIIFMSGYTEEDLKVAHPELDFLFLEKPFENRRIIETVKQALAPK
jgi:two-component system cell cycle sensor histidine kinase/response regulator CckA